MNTADPLSLSFQSKGLKTDKLPAHVFEIDEDAKDEVSRGLSAVRSQTLITAGRMSALLLTHWALYGQIAPCIYAQVLVMCYKPCLEIKMISLIFSIMEMRRKICLIHLKI